ncbi:MAG: pilus assembly protein [Hoeflea sp.]|uniref:TadE/TadG family type IV pilus assembly protein n=1 Tax=Hoeflea sp. TaxID=1940281 RepID=UPI0032ED0F47
MQRTFTRFRNNSGGSSAVEFAIIFPLFVLVTLSMIGYGIYLSTATSIQQVAADAARTAIAGLTLDEREELATGFVRSALKHRAFIDPEKMETRVFEDPANAGRLTVQLDYDATSLPIWNLFTYAMPNSEVISRSSVVRIGGL